MALRFIDGFGGQDPALLKWDVGSANYTTNSGSPRVPGGYYGTTGGFGSWNKTITTATRVFVGFGCSGSGAASNFISFYGDTGTTQHITVQRSALGFLEIRRGGNAGTLLATGTTAIATATWFYMEASATISDTVGEVHVRLNGLSTDEVSYVGDTKNAGTNTTIDRISVGTSSAGLMSDVYVLDSTGTTNNDFLGDVTVRTLSPSANGTYSQLTNSAATSVNNYTYVNEHPYSGTQYAGSPTSGLRDTYNITDLPAGVSTVYAVQINGFMAKSDATLGQAKLAVLSGASLYYGTTRTLSTSYQTYYDLYENDPNTSAAWTVGNVNALEVGMEVV